MKKIMFSCKYGLEQGVIARTKTKTRRVDKRLNHPLVTEISDWCVDDKGKYYLTITYSTGLTEDVYPAYQIGEEVAVAQSYQTLIEQGYLTEGRKDGWVNEKYITSAGYDNKMFVAAEHMPHRIRITDIKVERLQDISEEDAMKEGVFKYDEPPLHHEMDLYAPWPPSIKPYKHNNENLVYRCSARYAFAYLINKINGTGTWQKNPWVFAYTFELVQ